jgi:asparagine synthase (glutamine-hydrolysing)
LRAAFDESVRLHALADAPVGAFLSGGVDSTAIVALMRKHVPRLKTFTLSFPDVPGADEADDAADTARALEVEHQVVPVTAADVSQGFGQFCRDLDQPSTDGYNTWLVSRAAAADVKGVLSGLGADESFSGYPVAHRLLALERGVGGAMRRAVGAVVHETLPFVGTRRLLSAAVARRMESVATYRSPTALWTQAHMVFYPLERAAVLGRPCRRTDEERVRAFVSPGAHSALQIAAQLDTTVYMGAQLLRDSDAVSMAHSLELRLPFVDVQLVELARSFPDALKLDAPGGRSKRVLVQSLDGEIPAAVARRPKRGFSLPIIHWLRTSLSPQVTEWTSPAVVRARGVLDPARVPDVSGSDLDTTMFPRLYALAVLEGWCRGVLDARQVLRAA